LGEDAIITVANEILGNYGGTVVLLAALKATISSANASVLSSSRAVYALSKDSMIPESDTEVHQRFGTPYIAVLLGRTFRVRTASYRAETARSPYFIDC
jgi:basic amino acid/polyamine antiporter, APA family